MSLDTSTTPTTAAGPHGAATHLPQQRADHWAPLAAALTGELALPGDPAYAEHAAPWLASVPVRPAAVVVAADAADVSVAVRAAAERGLRVAVQATGHGAVPVGEDVLLVSTRLLDECTVHPEGWARVGAGVKWARVIQAAAVHGLAPLNGSSSDVGVVGYTTGGGLGPMARTFGLASDRVRAFEVVTADGRLCRATPDEHPDLFWGLRGGRGSLGVVTAVEFDLVVVPSFYGGALHFDGADAATVLETWRRWSAALPEEATTSVALLNLPPLPGVPPQLAGRLTVAVRFVHVGAPAAGEALLAPVRAAAAPLLDGTGVLPYPAIDAVHADPVDPMPALERALLLDELPREAVDAVVAVAASSPLVMIELRRLGGAFARPGAHPSAISHRDAACSLVAVGLDVPGLAGATAATLDRLLTAVSPWSTGRTLPTFGGGPAAYGDAELARLRSLVAAHDPRGLLTAGDAVR